MIPYHARVAAFDDREDHLRNIVNGLGKAGFWAMPFYYDAGKFEPELPSPFPGIRLVFSDIHLGPPLGNSMAQFASAIIKGLKKVVSDGPYGLIFWSQYPADADAIWGEISSRASEAGLTLPVFWDTIDKNEVMQIAEDEDNSQFNADKLRKTILEKIASADTLALAMSWDERVGHAALQATNRLYELANPQGDLSVWTNLLAYLAQEAVGKRQAIASPLSAIDNAMLPLLEDKISELAQSGQEQQNVGHSIQAILDGAQKNIPLPQGISAALLNSHYLIESACADTSRMWERGMVTKLGGGFLNSGEFVRYFGTSVKELITSEFILPDQRKAPLAEEVLQKAKLHVVELSAECDQVQCKIATHRYLLALWVPASCARACNAWDKKNRRFRNEFANASILNIGELKPKNYQESYYLLVSTRRFMILPPQTAIDGECAFRLRRSVIDELAHYYATYSRRPGILRFT